MVSECSPEFCNSYFYSSLTTQLELYFFAKRNMFCSLNDSPLHIFPETSSLQNGGNLFSSHESWLQVDIIASFPISRRGSYLTQKVKQKCHQLFGGITQLVPLLPLAPSIIKVASSPTPRTRGQRGEAQNNF